MESTTAYHEHWKKRVVKRCVESASSSDKTIDKNLLLSKYEEMTAVSYQRSVNDKKAKASTCTDITSNLADVGNVSSAVINSNKKSLNETDEQSINFKICDREITTTKCAVTPGFPKNGEDRKICKASDSYLRAHPMKQYPAQAGGTARLLSDNESDELLDLSVRAPCVHIELDNNADDVKAELASVKSDGPMDLSVHTRRIGVELDNKPDFLKVELLSDEGDIGEPPKVDLPIQTPCCDTETGNNPDDEIAKFRSRKSDDEYVSSTCDEMVHVRVGTLHDCAGSSSDTECKNTKLPCVTTSAEDLVGAENLKLGELPSNSSDKIADSGTSELSSDSECESVELSESTSDEDEISSEDRSVEEHKSNNRVKMVELPSRVEYDSVKLSSDSACESAELSSSISEKDRREMQIDTAAQYRKPEELTTIYEPTVQQIPDSRENSSCDILQSELLEDAGCPSCFDGLVGRYIPGKGGFMPKPGFAAVDAPSLVAPLLFKEPNKFSFRKLGAKTQNKDFFSSTAGKFLISLGLSRVSEWYHRDMVKETARQIEEEGESQLLEEQLAMHRKHYALAKKANQPFSHPSISCDMCNFATQSAAVLEDHRLVLHTTEEGEYRCSFCAHVNRDSQDVLLHMQLSHSKIGRLDPPPSLYACSNCTYEPKTAHLLNFHKYWCLKRFNISTNQAPPLNYENPAFTPRPLTIAAVVPRDKSAGCDKVGRGRLRKADYVPGTSTQASCNVYNRSESFKSTALQRNFPNDAVVNLNNPMNPTQMNFTNLTKVTPLNGYSKIEVLTPQPIINDTVKPPEKPAYSIMPRKAAFTHDVLNPNLGNLNNGFFSLNTAAQKGNSPAALGSKSVKKVTVNSNQRVPLPGLQPQSFLIRKQIFQAAGICAKPYSTVTGQQKTILTATELQNPAVPKPPKLEGPYPIQSSKTPSAAAVKKPPKLEGPYPTVSSKIPSTAAIPKPPKLEGPYSIQSGKTLSVAAIPKLQGSYPIQPNGTPSHSEHQSKRLIICEICDGYIKDLEQMSTHMELVHNVDIDQKSLAGGSSVKCQKCSLIFHTDQGLERHMLCVHGLITLRMQELASKGRDAGCCVICGGVYRNLVLHVNQIHELNLEPVELLYRCRICSDSFGLYRSFENHVRLEHGRGLKRSLDNNVTSQTKKATKLLESNKMAGS